MEKKQQQMMAIYAMTKRSLLSRINELGIGKDDIVSLMKDDEGYTVFYYPNK